MVTKYEEETVGGLHKITVEFKVTSEEYHDVTTLLYKGTFDVNVPANGLAFKGTINEYSTSITNLYEKGQVGVFHLSLLEVLE
jgi:hypothetical protein